MPRQENAGFPHNFPHPHGGGQPSAPTGPTVVTTTQTTGPVVFATPDTTVEPFIAPPGVTAPAITPGGDVTEIQPDNYNLFSTAAGAQSLLAQYEQAAGLAGLTISISVTDISSTYPYSSPSDSSAIFAIVGTATDKEGNIYSISDVAGQRLWGYMNPFVLGQQTFGDKNYKVENVYVGGVLQEGQTENVQVPGFLNLVINGTTATGIWVPAS